MRRSHRGEKRKSMKGSEDNRDMKRDIYRESKGKEGKVLQV